MKANIRFKPDLFSDEDSFTVFADKKEIILRIVSGISSGKDFVYVSNVHITDDKKEEN